MKPVKKLLAALALGLAASAAGAQSNEAIRLI